MSLLFEGRLSEAEHARIDAHIDSCAKCFNLVAELAQGLPPPPADEVEPITPVVEGPGNSISGVLPRDALIQGRYQILELAGVGGMGVIYVAHDHTLDRRVALKVLRQDRRADGPGEGAQARLLREAQTLARLSHPNVVVVYDVVQDDRGVYIAMELVAGRTLRDWLEGPPRPSRDAILAAFISAGRGLAAAHSAGVVHRDFKPDNVLVGLDGRVRVTDFGLARSPASPATGTAMPGIPGERGGDSVIAGTPRYMAPEQRLGTGTNARSDQFSFAVALHEALHGEHPSHSSELTARSPASSRVPRWLHRLLLRALSTAPEQRFASMDELCDALERGRHRGTHLAWGLAATSVVAAALGVLLSTMEAPPCEPAATHLVGVWDEPARQAMRDAMAATSNPARDKVEGELDAVASTWSERHDAACTAATTSEGDAQQQASQVLECLQQNLEQLRVLTDMSARADAYALAFVASGRLRESLARSCTSEEVATRIAPLPTDRGLRLHVGELRIRLDEVFGMETEGRLAEALALTTHTVEQAEATGFKPILAEALYRRGLIEHQTGDLQAAQQTLERALTVAEVAGHDWIIPEIWMAIVGIDASLGRLAEASRALDRATAFFARLQRPGARMARLHSKRATLLRSLGRHREAIDVEDQALAIYKTGPNPELLEAGALTMQATSYAALGAWDQALEHDRRALAIREQQLGPRHTRVAGSLNNIGVALMAKGDHDAARTYILRALAIREDLQGPDSLDVSHVLVSLGELERLTGRPAAARAHLEHVLAIRERILGRQHHLVAEALHRLGALLVAEGDIDKACALLERARVIMAQSVGPTHPMTALVVATLGRAELARGAAATARPLMEAAVEILSTAEVRPEERAAATFDLARALAADHIEDGRARLLAEVARDIYRDLGPPAAPRLAEVEAWLSTPPAP